MSIVVDNYDSKTYSLIINSNDKISGTNNNATFQVNWRDFLPEEYDAYKVLFSFQTSGGYYSDGITKILPSGAATANVFTSNSYPAGTASMVLTNVTNIVAGQFVVGGGFGGGVTVIAVNSGTTTVTFSQASIIGVVSGAAISFYNSSLVNSANYSTARIILNTGCKSYSFDTSSKAPSLNLGVAQRDIQTSQSKSNTLSTFYCQMPPRCMGRPSNNFLQIQIFNNAFFAGGITAYSGTTVSTYSTTATNANYLTDTDQLGTQINSTNDMTAYNLFLEFVPIETSRRKSRFDDA
jgi:hypothetical protein